MKEYSKNVNDVINNLNSSYKGLTDLQVLTNQKLYGKNEVTKKKSKSLFKKIIDALLDPMLIILEVAFIITVGVNLGKLIKGLDTDFYECIGILFSIALSVTLTVIMEGKSQKAYETLGGINKLAPVKVTRNGKITVISQNLLVVGDIMHLEAGDKIYADARIIKSVDFKVDESALTGESVSVDKRADVVLSDKTPLAERVNVVYSGTFVTQGVATVIVTAVGDNAEVGVVASELQTENAISKPLQEKLSRLSKTITAFGAISAVFVLILTIIKLFLTNNVTFTSVQNAFLNSIILIVASVPEGLPTTVAIALTLNVVKLSKQNALIKKLIATETVGCVSVICTDKTGTLTQNKMTLKKVVVGLNLIEEKRVENAEIINNICINSTADVYKENGELKRVGSATECALIAGLNYRNGFDYKVVRESVKITAQIPFSSKLKYMSTTTETVEYFKGAPEKIIEKCGISYYEKSKILSAILREQKKGARVICFARKIIGNEALTYDGFAVITDKIRQDVFKAVSECKTAGIKIKILTGDNPETAFSVASELKIASDFSEVFLGGDIDEMTDADLKQTLPKITVVARSTPKTKLRIVNALKELGEVVAVTGDGVNDAPAMKNADIGIAMGSGSEITKEVSDIILLNDSFSTIRSAIFFGRNIYLNFQRFIMFQLSVNVTAVLFIVISLIMGLDNPFNTLQLLWINVIMDGPPALTLGLELNSQSVMTQKPVKRSENIINVKMFLRILIHAILTCFILIAQYKTNFLKVSKNEVSTVIFTLFILFNLFNAFNCRETGSESIFKNLKNNKLMLITFLVTFVIQVIITEFLGVFFKTTSLSFALWLKMIAISFAVVLLNEGYKAIYRLTKDKLEKRV